MMQNYDYKLFTDEQLALYMKHTSHMIIDGFSSDISKIAKRDWMMIHHEVRAREKRKSEGEKIDVAS